MTRRHPNEFIERFANNTRPLDGGCFESSEKIGDHELLERPVGHGLPLANLSIILDELGSVNQSRETTLSNRFSYRRHLCRSFPRTAIAVYHD